MGTLPCAGNVLIGFGKRGIDMDRAEDLVEPDAVFHRTDKFGDELPGVLADDRYTQDAVFARRGEYFHHAMGLLVGDGPIEVVKGVARHLAGYVLLLRFALVQTRARDFRVGEGCPGDDLVVGTERPEAPEQGVDCRV